MSIHQHCAYTIIRVESEKIPWAKVCLLAFGTAGAAVGVGEIALAIEPQGLAVTVCVLGAAVVGFLSAAAQHRMRIGKAFAGFVVMVSLTGYLSEVVFQSGDQGGLTFWQKLFGILILFPAMVGFLGYYRLSGNWDNLELGAPPEISETPD